MPRRIIRSVATRSALLPCAVCSTHPKMVRVSDTDHGSVSKVVNPKARNPRIGNPASVGIETPLQ